MPFTIDEHSIDNKFCTRIHFTLDTSPFFVFSLLFTEGFISYLVYQTNFNAVQLKNHVSEHSRPNKLDNF